MSLSNYKELIASVKRRCKRNDVKDSDIKDYIKQAEAEFYNNEFAPIRIRDMEARATATLSTSSRFVPLPFNFLQMRALHIVTSSGNIDLKYKTPEQIHVPSQTGMPRFFSVTTQIELDLVPDSAYTVEIQYLQKVPNLSDSVSTNAILTLSPNIYIYGALWALNEEFQEFEVAQYYHTKFINAINGLNNTDKKGRYGPSPTVRIEGYIP